MASPTPMVRAAAAGTVALLSAALLTACGDDSEPAATSTVTSIVTTTETDRTTTATTTSGSAAAPAVDPCTLLSDEDIREAGGQPGAKRPDKFNGVFDGCDYGGFVRVYVGVSEGWMQSGDAQPVSGVGDEAFYSEQQRRLAVREDGHRFFVQAGPLMPSGDVLPTLRELADEVADELD